MDFVGRNMSTTESRERVQQNRQRRDHEQNRESITCGVRWFKNQKAWRCEQDETDKCEEQHLTPIPRRERQAVGPNAMTANCVHRRLKLILQKYLAPLAIQFQFFGTLGQRTNCLKQPVPLLARQFEVSNGFPHWNFVAENSQGHVREQNE